MPPADPLTDAKVAGFIAALVAAGQDCRDAVAWIRDWAEGLPK